MTIHQIYDHFTPGSTGFVIAVETHCGYEISRSEIERIAVRAPTADDFDRVWEQEAHWADEDQ